MFVFPILVALLARDLFVFGLERELRLRTVIEAFTRFFVVYVGGVAAFARLAEVSFVGVLMAVHTRELVGSKLPLGMALLALISAVLG